MSLAVFWQHLAVGFHIGICFDNNLALGKQADCCYVDFGGGVGHPLLLGCVPFFWRALLSSQELDLPVGSVGKSCGYEAVIGLLLCRGGGLLTKG